MFITIEGIDGCGKDTQQELLVQWLRENTNKNVVSTREPGGTAAGEKIRGILLDKEVKLSDISELLLFTASRKQHLEEIVIPAIDRGDIVVCNRYTGSTIAYQYYGRNRS